MGNCAWIGEQDKNNVTIETRENALVQSEPDNRKAQNAPHVSPEFLLEPSPDYLKEAPQAEIPNKEEEVIIVDPPTEPIQEKVQEAVEGGEANPDIELSNSPVAYPIALENDPATLLSPVVLETYQSLPPLEEVKTKVNTESHPPVKLPDGSVYDGEWHGNYRMGRGKLYHSDGSYHEGNWKNGLMHLRGRIIYANGDYYEGDFKNGIREGEGVLTSKVNGSSYIGGWKADKQHGHGKESFNMGTSYYEGEFLNGAKEGTGFFKWEDGSTYKGSFLNNALDGHGHYTWSDQREYIGTWKDNKMHGSGKFNWPDGREYIGDYVMDKKEGKGMHRWPDGKIYEGDWKDGKMHGVGFLQYPGKEKKQYQFKEGKKDSSK